jgi:hypothetical protein
MSNPRNHLALEDELGRLDLLTGDLKQRISSASANESSVASSANSSPPFGRQPTDSGR